MLEKDCPNPGLHGASFRYCPCCDWKEASARHAATTGLLRYFAWEHLPARLQAHSRACADLAKYMVDELPDGPELTSGLRKLLEAKDCFVRAALDK